MYAPKNVYSELKYCSILLLQMENIEMFLRACKEYGMNEVDTFQTQDLYETKSMYSVGVILKLLYLI